MLIIYIFFPISYKEGEIKQTFSSHILNSAAVAETNTWDTFCGIWALMVHLCLCCRMVMKMLLQLLCLLLPLSLLTWSRRAPSTPGAERWAFFYFFTFFLIGSDAWMHLKKQNPTGNRSSSQASIHPPLPFAISHAFAFFLSILIQISEWCWLFDDPSYFINSEISRVFYAVTLKSATEELLLVDYMKKRNIF